MNKQRSKKIIIQEAQGSLHPLFKKDYVKENAISFAETLILFVLGVIITWLWA
jgi:hypothetical protein